MLKEQKYSWNYSKGWTKGGIAPLLEEPAGRQCGWVRRRELLASPSPGTRESNMTLLTVSAQFFSESESNQSKTEWGNPWHHQLSAEEWISEKLIWSSYCHLTYSLTYDLVFCWTFPPFILHFIFHLIRNLHSSLENGMFCTAQICDWKDKLKINILILKFSKCWMANDIYGAGGLQQLSCNWQKLSVTSCNFNSSTFHFAWDNPHFQNFFQFAPLSEAHHY